MNKQPDVRADAEVLESDPFYIRTEATAAMDEPGLVLKEGDTFVLLDRHGEIRPTPQGKEGLYHGGTRFLSKLTLGFADRRPLLLGAAVRSDNAAIAVNLTNPDITHEGAIVVPRGTLHLSHTLVLVGGVLHHRLRVRNHALTTVEVMLDLEFDADFADIFEVRGTRRPRRGEKLEAIPSQSGVTLRYRGLDGVIRRTRLAIESPASRLSNDRIRFHCTVKPHGEQLYVFSFSCEGESSQTHVSFPAAVDTVTSTLESRRAEFGEIHTSNQQFNAWLNRSLSDLCMMLTPTRHGEYPYAGVPWFSVPFGRDGLITAFETLWINPSMARGVLSFLAATQATSEDPDRDAQPGKILHEMRTGEMAALGEIPFDRYYGTHDATPLFVMLAAAYYERTDDTAFIHQIWKSIEAALGWIEKYGDADGDRFVEYARQSPTGLVQQGWKDSFDSMFHSTGELAAAPIGPCEIQAYVYGAFRGGAALAAAVGKPQKASEFATKATTLFEQFDARYWNESIGTYVLALDGAKRPCVVRSSNAGHALFTGIAARDRAASVARTLMAPESFSGGGIRTIATSEARYNPMAYHNGSIWPHDNALIAAGLARYGFRDESLVLLNGMFQASLYMDLYRLPELFCGFVRELGEGPILYPVACSPQAWASASIFLLLQSVLGLEINAGRRLVQFTKPKLPEFLREIGIRGLRIGQETADLVLVRHDNDDVGINVLKKTGGVEIVTIK
jgi:glycogen debranching enzyme